MVGDGACGKSYAMARYVHGKWTGEYVPTTYDNETASLEIGGQPVVLQIWDTAGQEEYDRLRPSCYPDSDVVLIVFDAKRPE